MELQVEWATISDHAPIIIVESNDYFLVVRDTHRGISSLPTKDTWNKRMHPVVHPPKCTPLMLEIDTTKTLVYYVHCAHTLKHVGLIKHKRLNGKHTGMRVDSQRIIQEMNATYAIEQGRLFQRPLQYHAKEFMQVHANTPIIATKNHPGKYGVYLTIANPATGKDTLPTRDNFFQMVTSSFFPTFGRVNIPCNDGDLITVYCVNVDGFEESETTTQYCFNGVNDNVDADTRRTIAELKIQENRQ
ncbi:hypothetical protein T484DRAFT_1756923 [Baffinella frigidus]|nr:hypothetical protein T484DRAFT_1756923 [Cryptophyta sp. CCMP2293]